MMLQKNTGAMWLLLLGLLIMPTSSHAISWQGKLEQGALVRGTVAPGSQVMWRERKLPVNSQGQFLIGFDRDEPARGELTITDPQGHQQVTHLAIAPRQWQVQRINGIAPEKVTPPEKEWQRIQHERASILQVRARSSDLPYVWAEQMIWPAQGKISGIFGSQRILNGVPRAPHNGLDIANAAGTPVRAAASGRVVLAQPDMFYSGGTLILDHGYGLTTVYVHLQKLNAVLGQEVKQGEVIAHMGATGRATGSHLHWGVNWFDVALDPQQFVSGEPIF